MESLTVARAPGGGLIGSLQFAVVLAFPQSPVAHCCAMHELGAKSIVHLGCGAYHHVLLLLPVVLIIVVALGTLLDALSSVKGAGNLELCSQTSHVESVWSPICTSSRS
jgi:hypothetical protein